MVIYAKYSQPTTTEKRDLRARNCVASSQSDSDGPDGNDIFDEGNHRRITQPSTFVHATIHSFTRQFVRTLIDPCDDGLPPTSSTT